MIVLYGLNAALTALMLCKKALKMGEVLTDRALTHLVIYVVAAATLTNI
jgi:hypothetical protein